jgi:hypothetical protein
MVWAEVALVAGGAGAFAGGALVTIVAQQSLASRHGTAAPPLSDRLHRPEWAWAAAHYKLCDALAPSLVPLMVASAVLWGGWAEVAAYLWAQGALFAARPLFFWPTTLPNCSPLAPKPGYNERSPLAVLWDYATLRDPHHGHQHDLVFSGHTSSLFLHALMLCHFALGLSPEAAMAAAALAAAVLACAALRSGWSVLALGAACALAPWGLRWFCAAVWLWAWALAVAAGVVLTRCHYSLCVVASLPVAYAAFRLVALPVAAAFDA